MIEPKSEKPKKKGTTASELELELRAQLRARGIPYTREFLAIKGRKYRFDFAIGDPEKDRLLVEVQGGTWGRERSGHSTGAGIARDCLKNNLAVLEGYRVLAFTSDQVRSGEALEIIQAAYVHG